MTKPLKLSGKMLTIPFDEEHNTGENINLLSESEWRTIHNALAVHQCAFRQFNDRQRIQQLMNKVRDNYIAPSTFEECASSTPDNETQT